MLYLQAFRAILTTTCISRKYGYETTGRPAEVTVIATDARSWARPCLEPVPRATSVGSGQDALRARKSHTATNRTGQRSLLAARRLLGLHVAGSEPRVGHGCQCDASHPGGLRPGTQRGKARRGAGSGD